MGMRNRLGSAAVLGLTLLVASSVFAGTPGDTNDGSAPASVAASSGSDASAPAVADAPAAQGKAASGSAPSDFDPIAATTGTLGLFTLETGQTLVKHGWSFSGYADKFTRMPGSATLLNFGVNFGYGITDRLGIYVNFIPYTHSDVALPGELSLDTPSTNGILFPEYGTTIYRRLGPALRPGYVEDYPYVAGKGGGVGPVTFGLKYGLLSEDRGAPVSLSLRNDFIIPTVTSLTDLLNNGTQTGTFADQVTLAVSKSWGRAVTFTSNFGYRFTTDATSGGVTEFVSADQFRAGAGFIFLPRSRFQVMMESNSVVFTGAHTPDSSFGARDPVDGIWGVRVYANRSVALDAGYRYMLNLGNAVDRSGFIVKIGVTHMPEKPVAAVNHPPVVSCAADKTSVFAGSGDTVSITANGSDPDGDPITYTWMATGGNVNGTGAQVRWALGDAMPGNYTATVRVDDGRGGDASCSVNARVDPRPNRPPTVSLSSDRDSVLVGERVHFTATGSDPDGDPLTYTWSTNGGMLSGAGTTDDLDTTGVTPGTYTVTVRVEDGRGGAADASKSIQANAPPPPPQASKINECDFKLTNSARVDNVCKRVLDDVALRLQNEPRSTLVIVGYADPKERRPDTLAGARGTNVAKYLGTKGVDMPRITTRTGAGQAGAGQANRRIDIVIVPEGATY